MRGQCVVREDWLRRFHAWLNKDATLELDPIVDCPLCRNLFVGPGCPYCAAKAASDVRSVGAHGGSSDVATVRTFYRNELGHMQYPPSGDER